MDEYPEWSEEEEKLKEKYELEDAQLYWRRLKIAEGGELKFKQEYPSSADEAFIVSGSNVFNVEKLDALIPREVKSRRTWDVDSKFFDNHREGDLFVYDFPTVRHALYHRS